MKNILRRSLFWLLILVMVLGLVPQVPALAADESLTISANPGGEASLAEKTGLVVENSATELIDDFGQEAEVSLQASYPLIFFSRSESNSTIPYGETGVLAFSIWTKYHNERYNVKIYDSAGSAVGSVSSTIYNVDGTYTRDLTITVDTSELTMTPGKYKVEYWMDYYTFGSWHSAPNTYTTTLTVVENICHGSHAFVQESVYTEPTCQKEGKVLMECANCGHKVYQTLPVGDHDYGEGVETTAPTMTADGLRTYTCSICGETKTEVIPALSHGYNSTVNAPTCTEKGYTTHTCSHCNDSYVDTYVDALGHDWDEGKVTKEPTTSATGVKTYTCKVCGETKTEDIPELPQESTPMYRLYNPNSGEHFYTGSAEERDNLAAAGWDYEGIAWNAPIKGGSPIYRLYNPNNGDHHYTGSADERDNLVEVGWQYEGVAWNSPKTGVPLYRLYNPNADCGSHHYTGSEQERDDLVALGWHYEGVAWNGLKK